MRHIGRRQLTICRMERVPHTGNRRKRTANTSSARARNTRCVMRTMPCWGVVKKCGGGKGTATVDTMSTWRRGTVIATYGNFYPKLKIEKRCPDGLHCFARRINGHRTDAISQVYPVCKMPSTTNPQFVQMWAEMTTAKQVSNF